MKDPTSLTSLWTLPGLWKTPRTTLHNETTTAGVFHKSLGNASRFHRAHRLLLAHNQENKNMFEPRLW
jgi:hypothetical protein